MRASPHEGRRQTVLITGASAGIGAALAQVYAQQGARVALIARRTERLAELCHEINAATGAGTADYAAADVGSFDSLARAVAQLRAGCGDFTCAFANAGYDAHGEMTELTVDDYRRQFETNVFGVLNTIYAVKDDLVRTKGTLAIVGSVSGHFSPPGHSAYNMSKHAVKSLADTIRVELRSAGVHVIHFSTGFVATEIRRNGDGAPADDPIPAWLQISAHHAARTMARSLARRRGEVAVGASAKIALAVHTLFPGLVRLLLRLTYRPKRRDM